MPGLSFGSLNSETVINIIINPSSITLDKSPNNDFPPADPTPHQQIANEAQPVLGDVKCQNSSSGREGELTTSRASSERYATIPTQPLAFAFAHPISRKKTQSPIVPIKIFHFPAISYEQKALALEILTTVREQVTKRLESLRKSSFFLLPSYGGNDYFVERNTAEKGCSFKYLLILEHDLLGLRN